MFDKAIIDTDRFMDLSMSAKALYFLLGMEADDEGFVSYKKVMRIHGGNEDDIKILIAKNFLIRFDSGVVVITEWNKNNWLDKRRIVPTEYTLEKSMLSIKADKTYSLSNGLAPAQHSLRENRIEQNRIEQNRIEYNLAYAKLLCEGKGTEFFEEKYNISKEQVIDIAEDLVNYVEAKGRKYKNYRSAMHTFIKNRLKNMKKEPDTNTLILPGKIIN